MSDDKHPNLIHFEREMNKREVTARKRDDFDAWRNNPKKCPPGSDLKKAADALWDRYQQAGAHVYKLPARAPTATSRAHQRERHRGRSPDRRSAAQGGRRERTSQRSSSGAAAPARGSTSAARPALLGEAFHNPYTFIPFAADPPARGAPTPLTVDERDQERASGIIELTIRTLSPLLTPDPTPVDPDSDHKEYRALVLGDDVIVPATGVRGALRTLLTIITGGTLGYIDEDAWLCQGRDAQLGPAGKRSGPEVPRRAFLAEVIRPGSRDRAGTVRISDTVLHKFEAFRWSVKECDRPTNGRKRKLWTNEGVTSVDGSESPQHPHRLRLSGRPIKTTGKREGVLHAGGRELELAAELWRAYLGRHRHAVVPELRAGDLVWLEPTPPGLTIEDGSQVESIQWARWGRRGERLFELLRQRHPGVLPDSMRGDGLVDEISDLFGQVPLIRGAAGPFAARVRPDNLVFRDAASSTERVTLAPLQPPHPGCAAFYREADAASEVRNRDLGLRGYKIYRNTVERGAQAPWRYETQGVYDERGRLQKNTAQKVNKTVHLLPAGREGTLRVAFRALSRRELALVLAACTVDWRLGGGKPLGLGHCRVVAARVIDETGQVRFDLTRDGDTCPNLPEELGKLLRESEIARLQTWQASQSPVPRLRYPRAVEKNNNRVQRGGHVWFQRHAKPRAQGDNDKPPPGLEEMHLHGDGALRKEADEDRMAAQILPRFNPGEPMADVLYGYDLFCGDGDEWRERQKSGPTLIKKLEPFDAGKHSSPDDRSGGSHGQGREARRRERRGRKDRGNDPPKR